MTDKKHIEDLVNKLDSLFSEGVGHVDLDFKNNSQTVFTTKSYNGMQRRQKCLWNSYRAFFR